jgi:hypothetical protein
MVWQENGMDAAQEEHGMCELALISSKQRIIQNTTHSYSQQQSQPQVLDAKLKVNVNLFFHRPHNHHMIFNTLRPKLNLNDVQKFRS